MAMARHQRYEAAHWQALSRNVVDEAVGQWIKRLRACLKAKQHHVEHLLKQVALLSQRGRAMFRICQ